MMTIICWFAWRRWLFAKYVKDIPTDADFLKAVFRNNVAGCAKHPCIQKDMIRIMRT